MRLQQRFVLANILRHEFKETGQRVYKRGLCRPMRCIRVRRALEQTGEARFGCPAKLAAEIARKLAHALGVLAQEREELEEAHDVVGAACFGGGVKALVDNDQQTGTRCLEHFGRARP